MRALGANAEQLADSLARWAHDFELERITTNLFKRGEQKDLEREIQGEFGFRIRIQHDYIVTQKNDSLAFVRFMRYLPERWFAVVWGALPADGELTPELIYNRRREIGAAFLDPVMSYDDRWTAEPTTLAGRPATLIRGLWATLDPTGGGPFFTYGVAVPEQSRYYLIDGAVFAPGQEKVPVLWQLDAIARTFDPTPG